MRKVFFDTNILIDYYDNRPGASDVHALFRVARAGGIRPAKAPDINVL